MLLSVCMILCGRMMMTEREELVCWAFERVLERHAEALEVLADM